MTMSEKDLPVYSDYKDSLVAFVDILGFNQKVKSIKNSDDFFEIGKLLCATKATADNLNNAEGILQNFKLTSVSDAIIVTVPLHDTICTTGLVQLLHNIQYELIATNFKSLIRGYISRGPVYHKNGLLFGAGYCDAYAAEKDFGGAPRIVISPNIIEDAKRVVSGYSGQEKMVSIFDFIREDSSDGFYFVDYLKPVGIPALLPKEQLINERNSVKTFIETCLDKYKRDYSIWRKYKWLENYFKESSHYFEAES